MEDFSEIKVISFDGDGTLWDFDKVMRHSLQKVLEELIPVDPPSVDLLNIEKMIAIRNQVAAGLKGKVTNLEEVRLEAFRETLNEIGRPNERLATYLNQLYLKHRFEDIELFDDVMPTLKTLKRRYSLGLLSNGNSYPERCGLEGIFRFVVFSQDYGFEKPDPRIFQVALEKSGCSKGELLQVGDSLENDVTGARNIGIKCVWLNRKGTANKSKVHVDHEIKRLTELLDILP